MSSKNKGGREKRKPKQAQNIKARGTATPSATNTLNAIKGAAHPPQK